MYSTLISGHLGTMYTFKGNQTLVIVAHRLSTVEDCDKLLWLDKGCVKKIGIPSEVLSEYRAATIERGNEK